MGAEAVFGFQTGARLGGSFGSHVCTESFEFLSETWHNSNWMSLGSPQGLASALRATTWNRQLPPERATLGGITSNEITKV